MCTVCFRKDLLKSLDIFKPDKDLQSLEGLEEFLCLSPLPRLGAYKLISGLHTQARLLGARIKTDNQGWNKMAKGKGPKPI